MPLNEILAILLVVVTCAALLKGFPVAFTLAGTGLAFAGAGLAFGIFDMSFLMAFPLRIFGIMKKEVLVAIPLFVFMGVMLERSRVAEDLLETMGSLFASLRGGLGISVVLVGALLAASTGIVGATVVTMGLLSLPTMLKRGYDPKLATGVIAASGTLGQIVPPSIVLILLSDPIAIAYQGYQQTIDPAERVPFSVADLFAGALVPGLLLVGLYIAYVIGVALVRPEAAPAIPPQDRTQGVSAVMLKLLSALAPPLLLIIAVLGSILAGVASATEAASVGAVGATLLAGYRLCKDDEAVGSFARRLIPLSAASLFGLFVLTTQADLRLGRETLSTGDWLALSLAFALCAVIVAGLALSLWRTWVTDCLTPVMTSTMEITTMVFTILIGAALFSLTFRGLGGDDMVHEVLSAVPGDAMGALIAVMVVMFLLGFFLDFIEITFVVVPIVAPILLAMGVDARWLGVLMAINLQTSFLTPPFGFALFYLRGVAPESVPTSAIYRGALPFVGVQVAVLLLVLSVPALATWLPDQLRKAAEDRRGQISTTVDQE